MAELHILGQLHSSSHFSENSSLFCRYSFQAGSNWTVVSGFSEGQTLSGKPEHSQIVIWSHPLDIHFVTKGIQGWPKIVLQVSCLDSLGRSWIIGYGCCNVPIVPGCHFIQVPCWLPAPTTLIDKVKQYFIGGSHQLLHSDIIDLGTDRFKLRTLSNGSIKLVLDIIVRRFSQFGLEYK
ncbi:hypothetical protein K1T71_002572 [Dendrolimus kikuchii]|uniref:Uncharacterized protein n=1 Tax=Dendrolimus kikuchii TaxID=765133 RepID=A0ACC1DDD7_9NEOP|nr:hypothetical protein K1T71_002572 [Dendrolimus kikuchii]